MAATDPGRAVRGEAARPASLPGHASYFNDVLGNLYCRDCGTEWPCLPVRQDWEAQQDRAVTCKCSHSITQHHGGSDQCWVAACGCRVMRAKGVPA